MKIRGNRDRGIELKFRGNRDRGEEREMGALEPKSLDECVECIVECIVEFIGTWSVSCSLGFRV